MKKWQILVHLTDTCYWFATPFDDKIWIKRIFEVKKRSEWKMFSLLFWDLDQVKEYCFVDDEQEKFILEHKFFSSFILKKKGRLRNFFPEFETVCVRIENEKFDFCPVKYDFFENWWKPVVTTSVNISWDKNFYWEKEIEENFWKYEFIKKIYTWECIEKNHNFIFSKIFDLTKLNWWKILQIR